MRFLVTGGAGFIGSRIALSFAREHPGGEVVAFDNLRRRGSETNLGRLAAGGVRFVHGDVRVRAGLDQVEGPFDVVVFDASAEASVLAGLDGSPAHVLEANLPLDEPRVLDAPAAGPGAGRDASWTPPDMMREIVDWVRENEDSLRPVST